MVGIKAFIVDRDKLLLVKSSNDREELWEVPGGRYDVGEESLLPTDILAREIREELGNKIQYSIGQPVSAWIRPLEQDFVFLIAYQCQFRAGQIELSSEHTEYRWVSYKDWHSLPLAPGYLAALDDFWKKR